ncbi:UNVERIFIED_CONTAM: hypothetical protein Slati_2507300 [Sesamum latifolium]|uniref:Uncharacterized protein n=1 Tax=Sesamum latifolium TaxID=2727402 RepID=A0AAW2WFM6_9LAMI
MGTDIQFHALDQGREMVDGRTVPVRTRSLNVHTTIHLVSMCHGSLLDGHQVTGSLDQGNWIALNSEKERSIGWTRKGARQLAGHQVAELQVARHQVTGFQVAGYQVASSRSLVPGRWF